MKTHPDTSCLKQAPSSNISRMLAGLSAVVFCFSTQSNAQGPLFPSLDEAANRVGGNWKVVMAGGKENKSYEAFVVMHPPLKKVVTEVEGFKHTVFRSDATGQWESEYVHANIYDRGLKVEGATLLIAHAYGIKGHWGADSRITFAGDQGKGRWNYKDRDGGLETWVRLRPTVERIDYGSVASRDVRNLVGTPVQSTVKEGAVAKVAGTYDEKVWGAGNRYPHLRPKFYIKVYGENHWGFHHASIPESASCQVTSAGAIYRDGQSGFRNQIGMTYVVTLWPGVKNGLHTFRLDHLKIPFRLQIEGLDKELTEAKKAKIGSITLETSKSRRRSADAAAALVVQRDAVAEMERSIGRVREALAAAEEVYAAAAQKEMARLQKALEAEKGNPQQQANERRYSQIALRNLAIGKDVLREELDRKLAELVPALKFLVALDKAGSKAAAVDFPHFNGLRTKDAVITANRDIYDVIDEVDEQIAELAELMAVVPKARAAQRVRLVEAAAAADKANLELRNAAAGSYLVQAAAHAAVQIGDIAIASKGNPHAFVALAGTQSVLNLTLTPPKFHDAKPEPMDAGAASNRKERKKATETFVKGAAASITKSGVSKFTELFYTSATRESVMLAEERASLLVTRRVLGKSLAKIGNGIPEGKVPLLSSIVQGFVVDQLTEKGKAMIAEEMQRKELRAYAQAQLNLAHACRVLQDLGRIEDADKELMSKLRAERARLLAGRPKLLGSLARIRPALEYKKNGLFEVESGYEFVLEFVDSVPPYDLVINGFKMLPGTGPNRFLASQELVDSLEAGKPAKLDVTVSLR